MNIEPGSTQQLASKTARGGLLTAATQATKLVLTLVSAAVLARLLSPTDYGLASIVTSATGLLLVLNDPGLSLATIQSTALTERQLSSAFWLQVAFSVVITSAAVALAPLIAWIYDQPAALNIGLALAPSFLITGLYGQHQAVLRRQLRYGTTAAIDLGSNVVAVLAAIFVASRGGGYWALVTLPMAQYLVCLVLYWTASPWRPSAPEFGSLGSHLRFGRGFTGYKVIEYLGKTADRMVLGFFYGPHDLGIYSRALSLLTLPMTQVTAPVSMVLLPSLSAAQGDRVQYRKLYLGATTALAWCAMPVAACILVVAPDLVQLLLGSGWRESIDVFRWSSPAALALPMMAINSWLFISLGKTKRMLHYGWIAALASIATLSVSAQWGVAAVAFGKSVVSLANFGWGTFYATRQSPVRAPEVFRAMRWPFLAALLVAGLGFGLSPLLVTQQPLWRLLAQGVAAGAVTVAVMLVTGDLAKILGTLKLRKQRNNNAKSP